jgi:hypothetical protein
VRSRLVKVLTRRVAGVSGLLALTMLRLLTDGGLKPAVANELYLLAVIGLVVTWCLLVLVRVETAERPDSPRSRRPDPRGRPDRLSMLEDSVAYWSETAYLRHLHLRPAVRILAIDRLHRAGIDIDSDPRAAQILGPTCWELVRAGVEPPADAGVIGLTATQVADLTRTLESLGRPDFARQPTGEQR